MATKRPNKPSYAGVTPPPLSDRLLELMEDVDSLPSDEAVCALQERREISEIIAREIEL